MKTLIRADYNRSDFADNPWHLRPAFVSAPTRFLMNVVVQEAADYRRDELDRGTEALIWGFVNRDL